MSRFFSKELEGLSPYTPGEQPKISGLIKLNTNENPYEPGPLVYQALLEPTSHDLRLYPDPGATPLVETIEKYYNLSSGQVMVGNGSDEILGFAFLAYSKEGSKILFPEISYGFYPVFAEVFKSSFKRIPLKEDLTIEPKDYYNANGTIVLANPNAPTGIALTLAQIESILQQNPNQLVIVDEAYVDFGGESAIPLIETYDNLLVIQTFSKSRGLAGCRVGFAVGNAEIIEDLNRIKFSFNPYNLDRLAIKIATAAMLDEDYFQQTREKIITTRDWLAQEMSLLGCQVLPSQANFLFLRHPKVDGETYFQQLRQNGILVRHFDNPKIKDYIRVTIGTQDEMEQFLRVSREIIAQYSKG